MSAIIAAGALWCVASVAVAGHVACSSLAHNPTNFVTNTGGCALGHAANDSQTRVNADEMFNFDDWIFASKDEFNDSGPTGATGPIDIGLSFSGNQKTGTWSMFSSVWNSFSEVMLVFKDGSGVPDVYVGYLVNQNAVGGAYQTPFINPKNGTMKAISHVSAYVRNGQPPPPPNGGVPEPSTLALAMLGVTAAAYRRRRNT